MDKNELIKLGAKKLATLLLTYGHIVRYLDEDNEFLEYWTQDEEYISDLILTADTK